MNWGIFLVPFIINNDISFMYSSMQFIYMPLNFSQLSIPPKFIFFKLKLRSNKTLNGYFLNNFNHKNEGN